MYLFPQEIGVKKVHFPSSAMCLGVDFENQCLIKDSIMLKKKYIFGNVFDWMLSQTITVTCGGWILLTLPLLHPCFHLFAHIMISGSITWVRNNPNSGFKMSLQKLVADVAEATSIFSALCKSSQLDLIRSEKFFFKDTSIGWILAVSII